MKRKLSLLLAMVLAMTMVMGMSVAAFADGSIPTPIGRVDITLKDTVTRDNLLNLPKSIFEAKVDSVTINTSTIGYALYGADKNSRYQCLIVNGEYEWVYDDPFPTTPSQSDLDNIDYVLAIGEVKYSGGSGDFASNIAVTVGGRATLTKNADFNPTAYSESCYGLSDSRAALQIGYLFDLSSGSNSGGSSTPAHTHSFTWQTITEPTKDSDGLEGEVCSCGATRNTRTISAMDYAINKYADQMIKAAKPGQKITLEFGEFNSFPRYMMEKVAARMNENITFVFKFKQNKKMQTVTIELGTAIDLQYDWYGPDKMKELYGAE